MLCVSDVYNRLEICVVQVYKLKDNHGNYEERGIFPWSDNVRTQVPLGTTDNECCLGVGPGCIALMVIIFGK